jgi:NADH:ubiquinone oxidoreductase subunit 2 (subunit N)
MTANPNKKFEIPLAFLIGFLCMPTGLFGIMDLVLRHVAHPSKNPHTPPGTTTPFMAVIMLDVVVLALIGMIPFIAALGLWFVLLVAGRSRAAKLVTFVCLLFAIAGIVDLRLMRPR